MEKEKIKAILSDAMDIHLRILSSFFNIIKNPDKQKIYISYLKEKIELIIKKEKGNFNEEELNKIAKKLFWNLNFYIVRGFVHIIIHSLGSDKLNEIIGNISDEKGTPISQVIKYGVNMWYCKNLPIEKISKKMNEKDFSEIAKEIIKYLVINHIALHEFNYKDLQKIKQAFNLPQEAINSIRKKQIILKKKD